MFNYSALEHAERPYIIAEIGSNHNGNMELAKRMIDEAHSCGADCVKFQSWSKDTIFSKKVYQDNHFLRDDYRDRKDYSLESIVDEYSIDAQDHIELKDYCDKIGIDFASTPFSRREADFLVDRLQVAFIKVASMDVDNLPFLRYLASMGRPIVLSTGLSTMSEVSAAVECLEESGCKEIALLHCVSVYPPQDDQVNLNNIDMLRDVFGYPVGYSDHTLGFVAPVLSLAKRPCIIEKHFTLDKSMPGWDHAVSADSGELRTIVEASRVGFQMLGGYRKIQVENQERRDAFRRSIVAARDIKCGERVTDEDIDYKRPGTGISPRYADFVVGRCARRDIGFDEIIQPCDV